jgi:hypothetical protein
MLAWFLYYHDVIKEQTDQLQYVDGDDDDYRLTCLKQTAFVSRSSVCKNITYFLTYN